MYVHSVFSGDKVVAVRRDTDIHPYGAHITISERVGYGFETHKGELNPLLYE